MHSKLADKSTYIDTAPHHACSKYLMHESMLQGMFIVAFRVLVKFPIWVNSIISIDFKHLVRACTILGIRQMLLAVRFILSMYFYLIII